MHAAEARCHRNCRGLAAPSVLRAACCAATGAAGSFGAAGGGALAPVVWLERPAPSSAPPPARASRNGPGPASSSPALAACWRTAAALAYRFALLRLRERRRCAPRRCPWSRLWPRRAHGAVIAVGILLPVGWLRALPERRTTALVTRHALFGLMCAYLGAASRRWRCRPSRRVMRACRRRSTRRRACSGAAPAPVHRTACTPLPHVAGLAALLLVVRRRDEGTPRRAGAAPFSNDTRAGGGGLPKLARDERLGDRNALAGDRGGGPAAPVLLPSRCAAAQACWSS